MTVPTEYSLEYIASRIDGEVAGDSEKKIAGVATFDSADATQITFAAGSKILNRIDDCRAGAIIVPEGFASPGKHLIGVSNPKLAFAKVISLYHPVVTPPAGIHEKASIGSDVQTGDGVFVGAFATIGNRVRIGSGSIIRNGVFLGDDVRIGDQVDIHPNVTIMDRCRIGNRVTIHPGTVIGSDGYGYVADGGRHNKIPQTGIVQIDDDVEIGACNTIDRATFGRTWIQRGVKTDNLIHIAHNVVVGEDSIIVAQTGIGGSVTIGHHAIISGQTAISDHLSIGNHVTVGPKTGVGKSIPDGQVVSSAPIAMPYRTWLRVQGVIPTLPDMKKKVTALEKKLAALEKIIKQH